MDVLDTNGLDTQIAFIKAYIDKQMKAKASIPIGHEYFSMNPNVPQGSLPLFGGIYDRATYPDLWAWVQTQTGYCKTEAEWLELSASNNGNVPFYSDGDGSTTFRVPSLKCWIRGANGTITEVGSYLEAGLPNITGEILSRPHATGDANWSGSLTDANGAFSLEKHGGYIGSSGTQESTTNSVDDIVRFDASTSSSIYGNSATVQPESIVGLWLVKAYGNIEDTGTINEQQYIDDRIAALPNTFLPLAGGTMSGSIQYINNGKVFAIGNTVTGNVDLGWSWDNKEGAGLGLRSTDYGSDGSINAGEFILFARDSANSRSLLGKTNGSLTWDNKEVERVNASGSKYIRFESGLQLCWGWVGDRVSGVATTTLPAAYKEANYAIFVTSIPADTGTSTGRFVSVSCKSGNTTTTSFKSTILTTASTASATAMMYFTIGWWK